MPRVPSYGGPQVESSPLPGARLSVQADPGDFGAGVGRAIQGAGNVLAQVVEQEQRAANQTAVNEFDIQTAADEQELMRDPKVGALYKTGKNAMGEPERVLAEMDKRAAKREAGLANEPQKELARLRYAERRFQVNNDLQKHVGGEIVRYEDQTFEAFRATTENDALDHYDNPGIVDAKVLTNRAAINDYAERRGLPPEAVEAMQAQSASRVRVGVVERYLVAGRDIEAEAYFDLYKDEMVGEDVAKVEKSVADSSLRGQSQRRADEIVAENPSLKEALAAAREIKEPELRDAATARVKTFFSEQDAAVKFEQDEIYQRAAKALDESGGNVDAMKSAVGLGWGDMTFEQQKSLEKIAGNLRSGVEPVMDEAADREWLNLLNSRPEDIAKLSPADVLAYRAKLDRPHFEKARDLWQAAKNAVAGKAGAQKELTTTLGFNDRVRNTLAASGIIPDGVKVADYTPGQVAAYRRFETAAASELEAEETMLDRKATGDEVQKVIDRVMIREAAKVVRISDWGGDTELPALLTSPDQQSASYVPLDQIPAERLDEMRGFILGRGREVTDDKLRRMRAAKLGGDRNLYLNIADE